MSSPAKKRKLNNNTKSTAQPKGLEYFFSKQKQNGSAVSANLSDQTPSGSSVELTDEQLARKLQAEWDQEAANEARPERVENSGSATDESAEKPSAEVDSLGGEPPNPALEQGATPGPLANTETSTKTLTLQSTGMAEDVITTTIPLDESPLTFDPSKYVGLLRQHWTAESGDASYALLTRCFVLVSGTASRIKIVDTLVNCIRILIEGDPSSLLPAVSHASFTSDIADSYRSGSLPMPYHRPTYH